MRSVLPYPNAAALVPYVHPETKPAPVPEFIREQSRRLRDMLPRAAACRRDAAWLSLPPATRSALLAECTDRPLTNAERLRWRDLTDAERATIGARARGLARDLAPVAGDLLP